MSCCGFRDEGFLMLRLGLTAAKTLPICICLGLVTGFFSFRVLRHDPKEAAAAAEIFAKTAFVAKDFPAAHALLTPAAQRTISLTSMSETIGKLHPIGFPDEVSAIEFEPLQGQAAMNIYLKGQRATETFYYRLWMVGGEGSGYQVKGFLRGTGPYPPSNRRSL